MKPTVKRTISTDYTNSVPVDDAQRVEELTREYIDRVLGSFSSYAPAIASIQKAFKESIELEYKQRCAHLDELNQSLDDVSKVLKS